MVVGGISVSAGAQAEEVYVIRGFMNVFSQGMDEMQQKMSQRGIRASIHSNGNWRAIANQILARRKAGRISYPIVIIGHSYGAVEAPELANYLVSNGVPVELVIGVDPGFPQPDAFGPGIDSVVNYKIPSGKDFRAGVGFRGKMKTQDVSKLGVTHTSIDDHPTVHDMVIRDVRQVMRK